VYLAGYSVECILKALILHCTPEKQHEAVESDFRGQRAHQFEWLRQRYAQTNAPPLSVDLSKSLTFVRTWETSLRYTPGMGNRRDAERFLKEARKIVDWVDNRI
jgi:hypothetical protein